MSTCARSWRTPERRRLAPLSLLAAGLAFAVLAVPATGGNRNPTQCAGTAQIGTAAAAGCFHRDPRLGPKGLPEAPDPIGRMTRGYRRFGKLSRAAFLKRYWSGPSSSGHWRYPGRDGFAGPATLVQVVPGMLVDRFGRASGGTFLAPAGTAFAMRSIPPSNLDTYPDKVAYNYHVYRVAALFTVEAGAIAPWFAQRGGGVQFKTCFGALPCSGPDEVDVSYLIAHNDLEEVSPLQRRQAAFCSSWRTCAAPGRVRHASSATMSAMPATMLPKTSKVASRPRWLTTTPASTAGMEADA
jgi:hypothetical protein